MTHLEQADLTGTWLSSDTPGLAERRLDQRHMAVLQVGKLILHEQQALCVIRNISAGGVMVQLTTPLGTGDRVAVELKSSAVVRGYVAWIRDRAAGIRFDEPIDVRQALVVDEDAALVPRARRLEVVASATLTLGPAAHEVEVFDVSQGGAKIAWAGEAREGKAELAIVGLPARAGQMRWTRGGRAGIAFNLALPFDVLAQWALKRQPRVTLADV